MAEFREAGQPSSYDEIVRSWAERNGFSDWALALLWIIVVFLLFQLSAGLVAFVLLLLTEEIPNDPQQIVELFKGHLDYLFIGNSFGQIVFMGLATWLFVRLHTARRDDKSTFLRLQTGRDTLLMSGLAALLIVTAQPVIWFLGWVNTQIPMPEFFDYLQSSQMEMLTELLKGDHLLVLTLFHVGVVPAVCEEVLYRGYVMRAFEKSWGIATAIIASGVLFGLYHLQLANVLPLAAIGILLAYITWVSDSLYPAIAAHFVNNAGNVMVGSYYPDSVVTEVSPETMPPLWALMAGLVLSSYLIYLIWNIMKKRRGGNTDV